jgi:hypothetical protein
MQPWSKRRIHSAVRVAEIVTIVVLTVILIITYRELAALRKLPVALPNYQFEFLVTGDKVDGVQTRGTWIAQSGPPEPLQTTTIECRKSSMQCVESSAVIVFVGDRGVLEAAQAIFEVERWNDREIVTKAVSGPCFDRTLVLNLVEKLALVRASASKEKGKCREIPPRTLELVAGYKVRAEALQKAKMF